MRILHLNRDNFAGGACFAALGLNKALHAAGLDSRMLVRTKRWADARVDVLSFPQHPGARLRRNVRRFLLSMSAPNRRPGIDGFYEAFSDDRSQYGASLIEAIPPCDVLNLHFVAGLVDYGRFFPKILDRTVIVWTLHDMNPFTGGCHFDDDCGRWMRGCGQCPQLGSRSSNDPSTRIWKRKYCAIEQCGRDRFCVVAPSRWLARQAAESPLMARFRVETIPYSVDSDRYRPRDRVLCREVLGVPRGARVVLFVANRVRNRRKGYAILVEALTRLDHVPDLFLLTVGIDVPHLRVPVPFKHLGRIQMDGLMTLVYGAADVFAAPSLQDNLPNTVLESLACGTPVAGFDVGGISDMVREGETGSLARARDAQGLADAIERIVCDKRKADAMALRCRAVAEQEYSAALQAERYSKLYRELTRGK